jgi:hypothetical protein
MSIDLCKETGISANSLLVDKLLDPSMPMRVGRYTLDHLTDIHHLGDGKPVVEAITPDGDVVLFDFVPNETPFADTAVDADGKPICEDC